MAQFEHGLMWFRRDLRIDDNATLREALQQCKTLFCVFVFDTDILMSLPADDRRVSFIYESVAELGARLQAAGAGLIVRHGSALGAIPELAQLLRGDVVYAGRDYEPQAQTRDDLVSIALQREGRRLVLCKDHVIFEKNDVLNGEGKPYRVFTPYKNAWLKALPSVSTRVVDALFLDRLASVPTHVLTHCTLGDMGFIRPEHPITVAAGSRGAQALYADFLPRLDAYHQRRDFPALKGPSYLSVHLRFGTISIRQLVRDASQAMAAGSTGAQTWLSELIWRDFYFMILYHFPHVAEKCFKPEYDGISWESGVEADDRFEAWRTGMTGFPIVDAAMRQLNQTGYMHNRLRMIAASFLTKDLGIDWRRGERYFALKLNDFDLAANNGGWQWAASTGCDAQPYFRIFNPVEQSRKFDPQGRFIRRYVSELETLSGKDIHAPWLMSKEALKDAKVELGRVYPLPIVDHASARKVALARYGIVKK